MFGVRDVYEMDAGVMCVATWVERKGDDVNEGQSMNESWRVK